MMKFQILMSISDINRVIASAPSAIFCSRLITVFTLLALVTVCIKMYNHLRRHRNIAKLFISFLALFLCFGLSLCNYHENKDNYQLAKFDKVCKTSHVGHLCPLSKMTHFNYF